MQSTIETSVNFIMSGGLNSLEVQAKVEGFYSRILCCTGRLKLGRMIAIDCINQDLKTVMDISEAHNIFINDNKS